MSTHSATSASTSLRSWALFAAVFLALTASQPATAQLEFGPMGRPAKFHIDDSGEPVPVIITADGAKILAGPSRSAATVGRAKFLDQYYLADIISESGQKYYLAGEREVDGTPAKFIGWIAEADALTRRQALKDVPGIYLKGLIINQWRNAADRGVRIEGASALNGPGRKPKSDNPYAEVAELGLFSFYFVYARHQAPDGSIYYLLGDTPTMPNVTRPAETLLGWVTQGRIYEWSTRQAIQFDKNSLGARIEELPPDTHDGAKIFETQRELLTHLRGEEELDGEGLEPVAVEDTRVKHWQHNWQRFPLFGIERNDELPSAGPLYNVGYIGDQIYVDSGSIGAGRAEMDDNLERVEALRSNLKNIDILFVIDSTGSMRSYFPAAAEAVLQIANEVRSAVPIAEGGPELRFSVLFYRDYADEDGRPDPIDTYLTKRLPLTGNVSMVARFLQDEQQMMCDGCGGDEPEAVFHGIDFGITAAAKEVKDIGFRAVVLIGDKGNHRSDPRGYTARKIADVLKTKDYDFFCIHVANEYQVSGDDDARAFRDQCGEIERLIEVSSAINPEKIESRDPKKIAEAIVDAARQVASDLGEGREALGKIRRGEAGLEDIKLQYGVRLTRRLTDMMVKSGVDPRVFVEKSVQLFGQGWVSENDPFSGKRQIETVLLVDRPTLEQLMFLLAGFIKEPPSRKNVVEVWTKMLKDLTAGDLEADKTVAELIESHLGIPVQKKLLHNTLDEIKNLSPEELAKLWSEMDLDLHRLRGIYSEKELILSKKPKATGGFEVVSKEGGTRAVWWQGKGKEYAWIPIEELP